MCSQDGRTTISSRRLGHTIRSSKRHAILEIDQIPRRRPAGASLGMTGRGDDSLAGSPILSGALETINLSTSIPVFEFRISNSGGVWAVAQPFVTLTATPVNACWSIPIQNGATFLFLTLTVTLLLLPLTL